jgi:hypothetical protein
MKLYKQLRRERALARFRILRPDTWLRDKYGEDTILINEKMQPEDIEDYAQYVGRKEVELASLTGK